MGTTQSMELQPGQIVDRYGGTYETSEFVSAQPLGKGSAFVWLKASLHYSFHQLPI